MRNTHTPSRERRPGPAHPGPPAEAHQPHAEPREAAETVRSERWPAVTEHESGQAVRVEGFFQSTANVVELRSNHRYADQRGAAERVVDSQRIAPCPVADTEPALVVHRPHVVGRCGFDERRCTRLKSIPFAPRFHDTSSLENRIDRISCRPRLVRPLTVEHREDLLRAPR